MQPRTSRADSFALRVTEQSRCKDYATTLSQKKTKRITACGCDKGVPVELPPSQQTIPNACDSSNSLPFASSLVFANNDCYLVVDVAAEPVIFCDLQ